MTKSYSSLLKEMCDVFEKYGLDPNYFFCKFTEQNGLAHREILDILSKYINTIEERYELTGINERLLTNERNKLREIEPTEDFASVLLNSLRSGNQPEILPTQPAVMNLLNYYLSEFFSYNCYHNQNGRFEDCGIRIFNLPTSGTSLDYRRNADYINGVLRYNKVIPTQLRLFIAQDGTCYYANGLHTLTHKWLTASGIDLRKSIRFALDPTDCTFAIEGTHVYLYSPDDNQSSIIKISDAQAMAVADLYKTALLAHPRRIPPFIEIAYTSRGICADFGMNITSNQETIAHNENLFAKHLPEYFRPQRRGNNDNFMNWFDFFNNFS